MAVDKKISELVGLSGNDIDIGNDFLVIVDSDQNITKRITPSNLMSGRVSSEQINHIVQLTQEEYNLLSPGFDATTLYIILG